MSHNTSSKPLRTGSPTLTRLLVSRRVIFAHKADEKTADSVKTTKTEKYVGIAIREEGLKRSDLYITTKYGGGTIRQSMEDSLSEVRLNRSYSITTFV